MPITEEIGDKQPFSAGTKKNIDKSEVHQDSDLHSDTQKEVPIDNAPKINRNQRRNNEHVKYENEPESGVC